MQLCFATNNAHKLSELRQLVGNSIQIKSLQNIGCFADIPETGNTLQANSLLKAVYVKGNYNFNCFADDTGLEVDALNGAPGVYSARYAGEPSNPENNMQLLLQNLKGEGNRAARFKTVITLLLDGNAPLFFEGVCEGKIASDKSGNEGFGYDPIFIPNGFSCTFAEMTAEEKNRISHRGKAVGKLVNYLKNL
ncbi:Nucleoside 5-triphosphatase RdgB (dHAPTP, dITP, XTP-specific) [hydrothermal vent metagenome]|uniref:dITP/XTP pyrophosphatase n=1 Tax=hydrothermal vent metagenome TaxID=652676 RepID=A0A3B0UP85_9ZZZZ